MTERQAPWPYGEMLAGIVERVTFHNAENGFAVPRLKARGHRAAPLALVGHTVAFYGDNVVETDLLGPSADLRCGMQRSVQLANRMVRENYRDRLRSRSSSVVSQ